MTGYGQGSATSEEFEVRAEIRSVNNRFLDVHTRLPQEISSLEVTLKRQIQGALKRGRVDLTVSLEQLSPTKFEINRPLVTGYLSALSQLKSEFGLEGAPSLELVAKLPGALQVSQDSSKLSEALVSGVVEAVSQALTSLTEMRLEEGRHLATELGNRLDSIDTQLPVVEAEAGRLPAVYREKLVKRVKDLQSGAPIDETRLAQEAVMLADRSDITEEIARLKSHISQMRALTHSDDEVGKRIDFVLQEMNREANTILSKAGEISVSDAAIVIKTEVEKLREQAQNIE
ncbi:MAG TPA: YicC/YloC family endoribonuclease [Blastocatellia bacterium]|nr:YicC/YloC family endoribonuclease [Blastocatellia bacterium]